MRIVSLIRLIVSFIALGFLPLFAQQSGAFTYTSNGSAVTITAYTGAGGAVTVPATIAGLPVVSLGNASFAVNTTVTSIALPNSLTSILDAAFAGCTSLKSISFGSGLTTIGRRTFNNCTSLTSVDFPTSLATIGLEAFLDCTNLTNITFSNGLTSLGEAAFYRCGKLSKITLPNSLVSIGLEAFAECKGLKSVTFMGNAPTAFGANVFGDVAPNFEISYHKNTTGFTTPLWNAYPAYPIEFTYVIESGNVFITGYTGTGGPVSVPATIAGRPVTQIQSESFHAGIFPNNVKITGITFPDSVVYIGWGSFAGCSGLTTVGFGSGLTTIDHNAFYGCSGLTAVTIPASVTAIQTSAFLMTGLAEATFVGNAPVSFGNTVFHTTSAGFTLYYYEGKTGFTSPLWKGYPAIKLGGTHGSIEAWRSRHFGTTAGTGTAADSADPDQDGISNLIEYAFLLNPRSGNNQVLAAGTGSRGLPLVTAVPNGSGGFRLRTEYIRRKTGSNLRYAAQFSSTLEASSWAPSTRSEVLRSIDADWERVVIEDHATSAPRRFGRVSVDRP